MHANESSNGGDRESGYLSAADGRRLSRSGLRHPSRGSKQSRALAIRYAATVNIDLCVKSPACIGEIPIEQLLSSVLPSIYPSRYCQSDRLRRFATHESGHLQQDYWRR
ncbi:MAG: hypothetical protein V4500_10990 [Pseudomonadota bacterium]